MRTTLLNWLGDEAALPLFREHGLPADLAACLTNRASCLQALGRLGEALAALDEAFTAEDRAATVLQDFVHRLLARSQTAKRYRAAVDLARHCAQPERAWSYAQRAKGRTLTDLLGARADQTALDRQELLLVQQRDTGQIAPEACTTAMDHIGDQRMAQAARGCRRCAQPKRGLSRCVHD